MKFHITNLYNFNIGDNLVKIQHRVAEVARSLGFFEMGIFSFPVETDSDSELNKRMDGIIASLEPEDVVMIQLPTQNGYKYEQLLVNKIKAYRDTKVVFLLHDFEYVMNDDKQNIQECYVNMFRSADALIFPSACEAWALKKYNFPKIFFLDDVDMSIEIVNDERDKSGFASLCRSGFYLKKLLIEAVCSSIENKKIFDDTDIYMEEDTIHIGFGLHDKSGNYSVWVGAVIQSIVENTSAYICFHILHDDTLTQKNRERLNEVVLRSGNQIRLHYIDKAIFDDLSEQAKRFTIGAMFRVMLPELLQDVSKIIYLDADIVVNRDIKELWDVDISEYCLAAVPDLDPYSSSAVMKNDVKAELYFNTGVQYLNLERIRKKGDMKTLVLDYLVKNPQVIYPDQDAMNTLYANETLLLDHSWNYFVLLARRNREKYLEKRIYHYAGTMCILYYNIAIDQLYYEIISRTPWKEEICPNILSLSMNRAVDRIEQIEKVLVQVRDNSKTCIYYGEETYGMRNFYKMIPPKTGDYRVLSNPVNKENDILPCKELSEVKNKKDDYIVFVLAEADGGSAIAKLEKMGLKNEEDFFVIQRLLPPREGGFV